MNNLFLDDGKEKAQVRQEGQCNSSSSTTDCANLLWLRLWPLSCLPKLKYFMWHLAHNSLALRLNLQMRGIKVDTRCPMCNRLDEDGGHCILTCKVVKQCWVDLQLEHVRLELQLKEEDRVKTIILLWKWWSVRNQVNHCERGLSSSSESSR